MTTRYERLKIQRRMQRRIRLVVEERRMSQAPVQQCADPETTVEIPSMSVPRPTPAPAPAPPPMRAIGRVTIRSA